VKKYYQYKKKEHLLPTIKRIPSDTVWNEVKNILPKEKPRNTKGHTAAVQFRNVLDGILFVLRTCCQWKEILPKEYGSGSTCHLGFSNGLGWMGVFQKLWVRFLKIYDDDIQGIKWKW
jgi:transposase